MDANEQIETEEWKQCCDLPEGFYISNLGRLKTLIDNEWFYYKTRSTTSGYIQYRISSNGKRYVFSVHRLVMKTFNPVANQNNLFVRHINHDRTDARLSNLVWGTHQDNMNDLIQSGRKAGVNNPFSKLTEDQVLKIFYDKKKYKEIAQQYGINRNTVRDIKSKKAWKHIHRFTIESFGYLVIKDKNVGAQQDYEKNQL